MTPSGLQVSTPFASSNALARLGTGDMRWGDAVPGMPIGLCAVLHSFNPTLVVVCSGSSPGVVCAI